MKNIHQTSQKVIINTQILYTMCYFYIEVYKDIFGDNFFLHVEC